MSSNHKFESNKKYFTISIYTIAVILIGCVIFRFITQWSNTSKLISQLWDILFPFFMGFLIAYILNPVVAFFQRNVSIKLLKKKSASTQRGLAILISYLVMVGFIIVCLRFIIPQLYDSIRELSLMIPDIYKSIMSIFEHYRENSTDMFPGQIADMIETKTLPKLFELTNNLLTNIVPMLYEASMSFAKGLFNLFIAFIVSIYMTIDKFILKNAGKRLVLAIFNENFSYRVLRTLKDCHNIFSGFIIGKSIDSLIIGLLAFVAMTILKLPYTVLISVIIGVTNMIPYFGPFIGAIPGVLLLLIVSPKMCIIFAILIFLLQQFDGSILGAVPGAFILFIVSPTKCLIFIIMVFVLQQFDGLILGPKILGESTGVRPLLILFSITVGGAYFGPLGMFLGVPFFATVQFLIGNWVDYRLYKKNIKLEKEA